MRTISQAKLSIDRDRMIMPAQNLKVPFNKPHVSGKEFEYMQNAISRGQISGNGFYTKKCHDFLEQRYGFKKCLLTTSCTDALEMAAMLMNIEAGDEVIVPSFTFVSTANAFVRSGAKIIFADSTAEHPNVSAQEIESLISEKTRAIVVVHYAGVACDMDAIMNLAQENNLYVIEDAAQAINSFYRDKPLGSIGHMATFSFHETKNVICGEGGMLVVNDDRLIKRAEIIWEKGTNRASFSRGEVDKYTWVDVGSSFLPSELNAAYLFAQLECMGSIEKKRLEVWHKYFEELQYLVGPNTFSLPFIPDFSSNNAHIFYLLLCHNEQRNDFLAFLKSKGVLAIFHYLPLHSSPFYQEKCDGKALVHCDKFAERIVRLPLFVDIREEQVDHVIRQVKAYFE